VDRPDTLLISFHQVTTRSHMLREPMSLVERGGSCSGLLYQYPMCRRIALARQSQPTRDFLSSLYIVCNHMLLLMFSSRQAGKYIGGRYCDTGCPSFQGVWSHKRERWASHHRSICIHLKHNRYGTLMNPQVRWIPACLSHPLPQQA
jgi:hypothetical protein